MDKTLLQELKDAEPGMFGRDNYALTEYDRFVTLLDAIGVGWKAGFVYLKDPKGTLKVEIGAVDFEFVDGKFVRYISDVAQEEETVERLVKPCHT